MCHFKSGVIFKDSVFVPDYDDHTKMLEELGIADDSPNPNFVRAELVPTFINGDPLSNDPFADIEKWFFVVDQDILPRWYDEEDAKSRMIEEVKEWAKNRIYIGANIPKIEGGSGYYLKDCVVGMISGNAVVKKICGSSQVAKVCGHSNIYEVLDQSYIGEVCDKTQIGRLYRDAVVRSVYGNARIGEIFGKAKVRRVFGTAKIRDVCECAEIESVNTDAEIMKVYHSARILKVCDDAQISALYGEAEIHLLEGRARVELVRSQAKILRIHGRAQVGAVRNEAVIQEAAGHAIIYTSEIYGWRKRNDLVLKDRSILIDYKGNKIYTAHEFELCKSEE